MADNSDMNSQDLAGEIRQLRTGIRELTTALNRRAASDNDDSCPVKTKRGNKCLFGSPLTCCCWMFVCMIFIFFVFALISAVFGNHEYGGTCPAAGGAPQFKRV